MLSAERAPAFPTAILQDISFLNFQNDRLDNSIVYYGVMNYKSNHDVVYSCKYHVVWCPKYRRRVLVQNVDERLKAIIYQVAEERAVAVIEMEGMPDHVHRLVEVDPQSGSEASIPAVRNVAQGFSVDALHPCRMRREVFWPRSDGLGVYESGVFSGRFHSQRQPHR